jgi:O-antigen/teichoic acid export membrane protein
MSLKEQTLTGITWSFIDNIAKTVILFIIGLVLARLIEPSQFGIIGVTSIFLSILPFFSDGGFGNALIQKKDCTEIDISSVFFFNVFVSVVLYLLLFLFASFFSGFFKINELTLVLKVLGLQIIISSFGAVQTVILTKRLDFKLLTKISLFSQVSSGLLAILLAFKGFGVWALVIRTLVESTLYVISLFVFNKWIPKFVFDFFALKKLFKFGSNLLVSGLIDNVFNNAYYFVIGKYYSPTQLGYYTRADMFSKLPSQNLTAVIQRVSFPVMSKLQDDDEHLKQALKKLIGLSMFISCLSMFCMAASSKALVLMLLGKSWFESIVYLQLLCFSVFLYPIHSLNLNLLNVKGKSGLFLKLEILKKILLVPVILLGVFIGIKEMLYGMILFSPVALIINTKFTGKLINYSLLNQLKTVLPSFLFASIVALVVFSIALFDFELPALIIFFIQLLVGFILTILMGEFVKFSPYIELRQLFFNKIWFKIFIKKGEYLK